MSLGKKIACYKKIMSIIFSNTNMFSEGVSLHLKDD
jgi:hypothetical protein